MSRLFSMLTGAVVGILVYKYVTAKSRVAVVTTEGVLALPANAGLPLRWSRR